MRIPVQKIKKGILNPQLVARQLNQLYHTRLNRRMSYSDGVDIPTTDWDNLIILDACRYDVFNQCVDLDGDLQYKYSQASMTAGFLKSNFHHRDLYDTVYVTANPMIHRIDEISTNFHNVVNVWKQEGWDTRYNTVLPETMVEYGLNVAKEYPHKKIILHFLQPHFPFISEKTDFDKQIPDPTESDSRQFWHQLFINNLDIPRETVWEAYKQNLQTATKSVQKLITTLQGKNVVTSDHGNMIKERSFPIPIIEWGHPRGIYHENLVKIPWLVHQNGESKQISRDLPTGDGRNENRIVADRLENLGYRIMERE